MDTKPSFIEFLIERSRNYLYHFTYNYLLLDILAEDMLRAKTRQTVGDPAKPKGTKKIVAGVSLTRDSKLPVATVKWKLDVRFTLDRELLKNTHKIIPYNYWKNQPKHEQRRDHLNESEEFVFGRIKDLHKYLVLIEMLDTGANKYNTPNSDLNKARDALKAYQVEFGIPFKIINRPSW